MRTMYQLGRFVVALFFIGSSAFAFVDDDPGILIRRGHYKQAQAILEKRLAAGAQDADAMVLLAQVKLACKDTDAAMKLAE